MHRPVVPVHARAQKARIARSIVLRERTKAVHDLRLAMLAGNRKIALELVLRRNRREQIVDRRHANLGKHLLAVRRGLRQITHRLVSGLFADEFLVVGRRQQAIQLRPHCVTSSFSIQVVFASALIFSGASFSSSFTAVTVPDHRRIQVRNRLHRLHRAEDLAGLNRVAHLRQVDKHNVAQRVLRVIRNADGALRAVDVNPLVFLRVLVIRRIAMSWGLSVSIVCVQLENVVPSVSAWPKAGYGSSAVSTISSIPACQRQAPTQLAPLLVRPQEHRCPGMSFRRHIVERPCGVKFAHRSPSAEQLGSMPQVETHRTASLQKEIARSLLRSS